MRFRTESIDNFLYNGRIAAKVETFHGGIILDCYQEDDGEFISVKLTRAGQTCHIGTIYLDKNGAHWAGNFKIKSLESSLSDLLKYQQR